MGKSVNKNFKLIIVFLCTILSASSLCFSYLFGSESQNTKFYSSLMSVDAKVKSQSNNHFLHGSIDCTEEYNVNDEYNKYLELQRKTKTYNSYYNSLIVSSLTNENGSTELLNYHIDYKINDDTKFVSNLVEVCTYYDVDFMEAIGLPLFNDYEEGTNRKATQIYPKTGKSTDYGAYISASHAEEIVRNNGMLDAALQINSEPNEALKLAFRELLSSENTILFTIQNPNIQNGSEINCTLNNIYLDTEHSFLFNEFQISVGTRRYNDYYVTFEKYFKDSVFTFAPYIFNKGSSYYFDIRKNYGNLDRFFNDVTTFNFAKDNLRVELYSEDGNILEESNVLNDASLYVDGKIRYVWLILALVFASFIIMLRDLFDKSLPNKIKLIITASPLGIFALLQVIFYLLLDFGYKKYALYNVFNPMGNIIFLICIAAVIVNEFIWRIYVKKN